MATIIFASNRLYGLVSSRLEIMEALQEDGHRIIACGSYDKSAETLEEKGIEYKSLKIHRGGFSPFADTVSLLHVCWLILKVRPNIIHCFNAKAILFFGLVSSFFIKNKDRKMKYTVTGLGMSLKNRGLTSKLAAWGYKKVLNSKNSITIFQNNDDYKYFLKQGWVDKSRSKVIVSSGVDINKFSSTGRTLNEKKKVVFVGRLLWDKGIKEFIEAAEAIGSQRDDVEFIIAGEVDDSHPNRVPESYIKEKSKQKHISYLGYIDDMPSFLNHADIFLFPSYYAEGVPRVNLEAAACGLPVITCDSVGCRETVKHGETGYLVPPKDTTSIVSSIESLLNNPDRYQSFSTKARSYMVEKFDKQKIIKQYLDLYK